MHKYLEYINFVLDNKIAVKKIYNTYVYIYVYIE